LEICEVNVSLRLKYVFSMLFLLVSLGQVPRRRKQRPHLPPVFCAVMLRTQLAP
jgi:hypothetical protein